MLIKNKSLYIFTAIVLLVGVFGLTKASTSFVELFAKFAGEKYADKLPVPTDFFETNDFEIGTIATSTVDWSNQPNISIDGSYKGAGLRFDKGSRTKDGISYGYENGDFLTSSSTIFSIGNTSGKNIYVTNGFIKTSGLATSTTQLFIGTSTDGYINLATYGAIINPTDSITSIMDNVLITDVSLLDATNTVFSLLDFPGSDTGKGNYGIIVNPGEFIVGFASTTDADNDGAEIAGADTSVATTSYFDGSYWLEYIILD